MGAGGVYEQANPGDQFFASIAALASNAAAPPNFL